VRPGRQPSGPDDVDIDVGRGDGHDGDTVDECRQHRDERASCSHDNDGMSDAGRFDRAVPAVGVVGVVVAHQRDRDGRGVR